MRNNGSSLEKMMIEGNIEGKRSSERTPIDQIKSITGYHLEDAIRLAENRKRWKEIVANIN